MSYSRNFNGNIRVSIPYRYPASQQGGSGSVSADVPVSWTVYVDTDPFDHSIMVTENQVNVLTGSVRQAEAAEVDSILRNAKTVSSTIVGGFFSYIRSDLSQQTSELRPKVEAKMIQLLKLQEACKEKIAQMTEDFNRISERYTKIFDTLDNETRNRIIALNGKLFSLEKLITAKIGKSYTDSLFTQSTISNMELESLSSRLFGTRVKGGAMLIIERTKHLLQSDKILSRRINSILSAEQTETPKSYFLPVVVIENTGLNGGTENQMFYSQRFGGFAQQNFKNKTRNLADSQSSQFTKVEKNDLTKIGEFMKNEITTRSQNSNPHTERVMEKVWQMWKENFTSLEKQDN